MSFMSHHVVITPLPQPQLTMLESSDVIPMNAWHSTVSSVALVIGNKRESSNAAFMCSMSCTENKAHEYRIGIIATPWQNFHPLFTLHTYIIVIATRSITTMADRILLPELLIMMSSGRQALHQNDKNMSDIKLADIVNDITEQIWTTLAQTHPVLPLVLHCHRYWQRLRWLQHWTMYAVEHERKGLDALRQSTAPPEMMIWERETIFAHCHRHSLQTHEQLQQTPVVAGREICTALRSQQAAIRVMFHWCLRIVMCHPQSCRSPYSPPTISPSPTWLINTYSRAEQVIYNTYA